MLDIHGPDSRSTLNWVKHRIASDLPTRISVQNYSETFISRERLYVARSPRVMMQVIPIVLRVCIVTL